MRTEPTEPRGRSGRSGRSGRPWRGRWRSWRHRNATLAAVLFIVAIALLQVVLPLVADESQPARTDPDAIAFGLLLLGPVLLWWRNTAPGIVVASTAAVTLVYLLLGYPYGPIILSPIIAAFAAIRNGRHLAAWATAFGLLVIHLAGAELLQVQDRPTLYPTGLIVGGWMAVILGLAELLQLRTKWVRETSRAQQAEADTRLSDERLRIARELHDVVAHNISLINVQAGVALHLIDTQPQQARTALTAIKQASKEALVELRSVLGVLRQVDEPEPTQPAPSMARLEHLVERTRQANLDITIETVGEPRTLPPGIDVAAYRIVQEALTNVVRHARARSARVTVDYKPTQLSVEIDDDGRGPSTSASVSNNGGSGVAGMRERAEALGGQLRVGRSQRGGFSVKATLPTEGAT